MIPSRHYLLLAVTFVIVGAAIACGALPNPGATQTADAVAQQDRATVEALETRLAEAAGTSTAGVEAIASATAQVVETGTARAGATNTAAVEATQTEEAERATETQVAAESRAATSVAVSTASARRVALAEILPEILAAPDTESVLAVVAEIEQIPPEFLVESGSLLHLPTLETVKTKSAEGRFENFMVSVRFTNPYAKADGTFDFGFIFRSTQANSQYRLVIRSTGGWGLQRWEGSHNSIQNVQGARVVINTDDGGTNEVILIAYGNRGVFLVNSALVARLDLSSRAEPGLISIGTGFVYGDEISGKSTRYTDFTVWRLATP